MQVKGYYKNFISEDFDSDGVLNKFEINCPENFNFAYDVIDKFAELEPARPALLWTNVKGEEKTFSYGELSKLSNKAANLFVKNGVKKGDKIMLVLKRNYQFWLAVIALHKIGAVAIPATHLLTVHDLVYRFEQASVSGIVVTADNPELSGYINTADEETAKKTGNKLNFKFIASLNGKETPENFSDFDEALQEQSDVFERAEIDSREMMLLYFTSGTTGYPKMVTHNYRYALAHVLTAAHWQNIDPDGVHLTIADTGWAKSAWGKLYGQMLLGSCVFVYDFDKFVPADVLKKIQDYKITSFCAPPTMFRFFIKEGIGAYDLSNLKHCCIAGEALNPEVFNRWKEYTNMELMEGFGQTESVVMLANLRGMKPKPGSMGKPVPLYNMDIVDEDGNSVETGEVGEIVVRAERGADGLFGGYYRAEELTSKGWNNGIYHTGDTAYADEDGYYWYVGRNDDLIKASGYRIGPFEIESVLITHPAVLECAVTGTPDPIRGQVVKATIVLTKEYKEKETEALIKEIQDYVKTHTAPYKYPRVVEFVNELPKTISGKIKRAEIRKDDGA